jgi:hypothetical protein
MTQTGQQSMSQAEVDRAVREMRMTPQNRNKPVLGIFLAAQMQAKRMGFPKHMYHATLAPRLALDEIEEEAYNNQGYTTQYIPREYPKFLYRRNMDPRYEPHFDRATNILTNEPYVEGREVKDEHAEKLLRTMKPKAGQSVWYTSVAEINDKEPIQDGPEEDPAVTIARLEGELAGARAAGKGK